jgi:hypothetical protein
LITIYTILLSLGAGFFLGTLYTILFVSTRSKLPVFTGPHAHHKYVAYCVLFAIARFALLLIGAWFFFTMPSINQIIMILSFLVTFWLLVLKYKAFCNEGHESF